MKRPLRILIATLIAAALITALWWEENWRGQRIWEQSCARLRTAGHPVEIKEIIPPPVPDELNVAMAPIFAELLKAKDISATRLGPMACKWKASGTYGMEYIPVSRPMSRTDLSLLSRWATFLRECFPAAAAPVAADNPADEVLRFYAKWDTEWNDIRAALERPHCRWPLKYENGINEPVPHLNPLLKLNLNSRGWIAALAAKNDAEAYTGLLLTLMKLERCVGADPESLLAHLVGCTMTMATLRAWQHTLPLVSLNETQLARLQAQLERISLREAEHALKTDLVSSMHTCLLSPDGILAESVNHSAIRRWPWPEHLCKVEDWTFDTFLITRPHGWRLGDFSRLQDGLHASGMGCIDAERGTLNKARIDGMGPEARRSSGDLGWYTFSRHLLPETVEIRARLLMRTACMHATVRSAMVWCAAERFRLKTGRAPQSQAELVPEFLKAIQVDPVGGAPLRFVSQDDGGLRIYSPGWDAKDDGGMRGRRWELGDWGWATHPLAIESPEDIAKWADEDKERAERANRPPPVKKVKSYKKRPTITTTPAP